MKGLAFLGFGGKGKIIGLECEICFWPTLWKKELKLSKKDILDTIIDVQNHSFTKLIFMARTHAHTLYSSEKNYRNIVSAKVTAVVENMQNFIPLLIIQSKELI